MKALYAVAIVVEFVLAARIVGSPILRRKYLLLASFLAVAGATDTARIRAWPLLSWDYSTIWAATQAPYLLFGALAAFEIIGAVNRQYGSDNRGTLRVLEITAAIVFGGLSVVEVRLSELLWLLGNTTTVEFMQLATRVLSLTWAAVIAMQFLWLRRALPVPTCPNLICSALVLTAYFACDGLLNYAVCLLWPYVGHALLLNVLAALGLTVTIGCWSTMLWSMRPAREWDWEPLPVPAELVDRERERIDLITNVTRIVWRLASRWWTPRVL